MDNRTIRMVDAGFDLGSVDLDRSVTQEDYDQSLATLQKRLTMIQQAYLRTRDKAVIVFEGWDAAGKGGTIRLMSSVLDPRGFKVWPIGAPTEAERGEHYLQRFWRRLPGPGEIVVFDRSWYGRVLVERVEGFAEERAWRRAYGEIVDFERALADSGIRFVKIFMHISPQEQKKRFVERLRNPLKRWKLSYEDFRNREKWPDYEAAITDMVAGTSTDFAPWRVISSQQKKSGRIEALTEIALRLSDGIDLSPRPLDLDLVSRAQIALGIDPSEAIST